MCEGSEQVADETKVMGWREMKEGGEELGWSRAVFDECPGRLAAWRAGCCLLLRCSLSLSLSVSAQTMPGHGKRRFRGRIELIGQRLTAGSGRRQLLGGKH